VFLIMEISLEFEIGIVEYRNILKVIKETYNYDYSDYALISFKRRIERVLQLHNLKHADVFIEKLREDPVFFQHILQEISVESTEMFRDPSFWRYLRDELFPILIKDNFKSKIWFPSCVSGDELYTLAVILHEQGWSEKFEIVVTCINDLVIDRIKSGIFTNYKIEASSDNYSRYQGKAKLGDYFALRGEQAYRDTSLIKNVNFIKQNVNFDNLQDDVKLIFSRNQLIYYTQSLHDKMLKIFYDSLVTGGYLAIGVKELIGMISSKYFKVINETESVYKKI
jgi:chemotaxis protein methyltransferase CheR